MTINDPSLAIINVEDYPDFDPDTEEGQEGLSSVAYWLNQNDPSKWHFLFMQQGQQIGEMIVRRPFLDTPPN